MIGSKGHNKRFLQISFISAMLCFAALALLATEFHGFYHQGLDSAKVSAKHKRSPGSPTYSECVSQLTFQSTNGRLYVNGIPFDLKGLNWFGMEDTDMVPEGCSGYYSNIPTCYAFYFNFIQSNGFNALRFPLALDAIDNNYAINQYPFNSSWKYLDILTNFVETAADYGLLIMLDFHLIYHGTQIPDLWNDTTFSNTKITQLIQKVIDLYDNQWNILAIDLKNEPHGTASWGDGKSTDWRLASQQFANYLYANQPTWLAFVEGVEGNTAGVTSTYSGQWGGNLIGAVDFPLEVTDPSRLVYSVHVYGPDVTTQSYFNAPNYPANLPAIWQQQWGFVSGQTGNAVVLGEWGGKTVTGSSDELYENELASWLVANGDQANFYWDLNPTSWNTGGILLSDWKTPDSRKLTLLASVQPTPTVFTKSGQNICITSYSTDAPLSFVPSAPPSTISPTLSPTSSPTLSPTSAPILSPTPSPTHAPTLSPTSSSIPSFPIQAANYLVIFTVVTGNLGAQGTARCTLQTSTHQPRVYLGYTFAAGSTIIFQSDVYFNPPVLSIQVDTKAVDNWDLVEIQITTDGYQQIFSYNDVLSASNSPITLTPN